MGRLDCLITKKIANGFHNGHTVILFWWQNWRSLDTCVRSSAIRSSSFLLLWTEFSLGLCSSQYFQNGICWKSSFLVRASQHILILHLKYANVPVQCRLWHAWHSYCFVCFDGHYLCIRVHGLLVETVCGWNGRSSLHFCDFSSKFWNLNYLDNSKRIYLFDLRCL